MLNSLVSFTWATACGGVASLWTKSPWKRVLLGSGSYDLGRVLRPRTASLPGVGFIIPTAQDKKHVAQRGLRNLCRSPGLHDLNSGLCDSEIFTLVALVMVNFLCSQVLGLFVQRKVLAMVTNDHFSIKS